MDSGFFQFVTDSRGIPIPPPPLLPQPPLNDGHVHFMQGVHDSHPIADLTPVQMGVLLTFQPVNAGYIMEYFTFPYSMVLLPTLEKCDKKLRAREAHYFLQHRATPRSSL